MRISDWSSDVCSSDLQWNAVTLYPAGYFARGIPVSTSVKLPDGWTLATALETTSTEGAVTRFKTVPFERLVDSPIRTEERRVGKECGSTDRSRGSAYIRKKKKTRIINQKKNNT